MPNLGRTRWWWGFGLLIATPALVLAVLGLRSVNLQEADRRHQIEEHQGQAALALDTALGAALSGLEDALLRRQTGSVDSSPWFTLSRSGELAFPSDRIVFSDFSGGPAQIPHALPAPLQAAAEEGLAAEARSDYPRALAIYQELARSPKLSAWGRLAVTRIGMRQYPSALLDWVSSLQPSDSDSLTPDGAPVMLLATGYTRELPPLAGGQIRTWELLLQSELSGCGTDAGQCEQRICVCASAVRSYPPAPSRGGFVSYRMSLVLFVGLSAVAVAQTPGAPRGYRSGVAVALSSGPALRP